MSFPPRLNPLRARIHKRGVEAGGAAARGARGAAPKDQVADKTPLQPEDTDKDSEDVFEDSAVMELVVCERGEEEEENPNAEREWDETDVDFTADESWLVENMEEELREYLSINMKGLSDRQIEEEVARLMGKL